MEINKNSIKRVSRTIIKSFLFIIYISLIIGLIAGGLSTGIMTLIPDEASKPCYLGYYAHCSFTPYSTLILFAMAIIGTILLLKLIKYVKRQYTKFIEAKPTIKAFNKN
ncbi:MAG: hypothetical protein ACFFCV_17860 [Promethearchaeota archaeon]